MSATETPGGFRDAERYYASRGITFKYEIYPDGSWTAESTNFNGIITGGKNTKEINSTVKDAIFTYFGVPAQKASI